MLLEARNSPNLKFPRPLRGKGDDSVFFQRLQQGQGGLDLQRATGGSPVEVLAHGERQRTPAQVAEGLNRLLNPSQLFPGEPSPAECRLR